MNGRGAPVAIVTGASGFVGSHIADTLLDRGARVRCLLRARSSTRWLEGKEFEIVRVPLEDERSLEEALRGATWIVHAAGETAAQSADAFFEANVRSTERVLRAACHAAPDLKRFVLVSSQAASGPSRDGRPVVESDVPRPASEYGISKLRAEELTLALRDRLPVVCIRPPGVYGPRDRAFLKLFRAARWHVRPRRTAGNRISLVRAEDLAQAVWLALTHDRAAGEVFFASDPDQTSYDDFGRAVADSVGAWTVPVEPPLWLLHTLALLSEGVGALTARPPLLSRRKIREITAGDWICSSAKLRERLGWSGGPALAEGVRRTAEWYRSVGWL